MKRSILRKKNTDSIAPVNNKKVSKFYLGISIILFLLFLILSLKSIKQPLKYQEKSISNKIVQKTNITYSTEVLQDGMSSLNGAIFPKVQKNLKIHVTSTVTSEKPVSIEGQGNIYCNLIAEESWKQVIPIASKIKIDLNGNNNTIVNSDFEISLVDIKSRMEKVESQITGISSGKHILKIVPDLQANILFENKKIPLDNTYELSFEYASNVVKPLGENKELIKDITIEDIKTNKSIFRLLGIALPLVLSRYLLSSITIGFFILIIMNFRFLKLGLSSSTQTASYIDKKYRDRLIVLQQEPNLVNRIMLSVGNFKELIQVANDKDLSLLRYNKGNSDIVIYLAIDGECIYYYMINDSKENTDKEIGSFPLGNDIFNV